MGCEKCNECNEQPCTEVNGSCDCIQKDMSTDCILYTGEDLTCSGITNTTILTEVITKLDAHICNKFQEAVEYLRIVNVGDGAEVYSGINGVGARQLRSIVTQESQMVDIVQNEDTISITPGRPSLNLTSDLLTLVVTTLAGNTQYGQVDLSQYSNDTFLQTATFNNTTFDLVLTRNEGLPDVTVNLSTLNNYLVSGTYSTNVITLTLVNGSTVSVDISALRNEILGSQVQSDVLTTNTTSSAFIQNKNPTRTVQVTSTGTTINITNADNNYAVEIDNSTNNVTIDFANVTTTNNFFVGIVQKGTGVVTLSNYDILPQDTINEIYGQGHIVALSIINSTKYLHGNLKSI